MTTQTFHPAVPVDLHDFDTRNFQERCGLLLWKPGATVVAEMPNKHRFPKQFFTILQSSRLRGLRENPDWQHIGYFHTHTPTQQIGPSEDDLENLPVGLYGVIYHPASGTVTVYAQNEIIQVDNTMQSGALDD